MSYKRPSWDEYFMEVARSIAKRGTCDRGRIGSILVKDKRILASGYVGSPVGFQHCDDVGHDLKTIKHGNGEESVHCTRTIHSEHNAIYQSAKNGISIDGATLYVLMTPCKNCAMALINAGIKRVVCEKKYHYPKESEEMLKQAGIQVDYMTEELMRYDNQKPSS